VFLTAAHCDLGVSRVAVTFDSSYDPATGTEHWGTWHADPGFTQAQNDPHDIAVVVFDAPVIGIAPVRLPAAGSLGGLEVRTPSPRWATGRSRSPSTTARASTTPTSALSPPAGCWPSPRVDYRLDTSSARAFLGQYVILP
jgi:hypothetical protein